MTTRTPAFASTPEVARLIGADPWNLNRWAARGWLQVEQGPGSGKPLTWTPDAIQHAAIVVQLVQALGCTPHRAALLADVAISNDGVVWVAEYAGLWITGPVRWVPEPPAEVEP